MNVTGTESNSKWNGTGMEELNSFQLWGGAAWLFSTCHFHSLPIYFTLNSATFVSNFVVAFSTVNTFGLRSNKSPYRCRSFSLHEHWVGVFLGEQKCLALCRYLVKKDKKRGSAEQGLVETTLYATNKWSQNQEQPFLMTATSRQQKESAVSDWEIIFGQKSAYVRVFYLTVNDQ